jgi:biotin/methionine sulfoxide reductase
VPVKERHVYLSEFRANPEKNPLATESGRILLASDMLARLDYMDCPSHPAWLPPREWLGSSIVDENCLHLISHQPVGRLHSQLETAPASLEMKRGGREQVRINPVDARKFGISDGQTVRLWNERGQCLATAAVCNTVRQGVLVLPTGAWFTPDEEGGPELSGNPNVLTLDVPTSRFSQGCSAYTCLVRVEPYRRNPPHAVERFQELIASLV